MASKPISQKKFVKGLLPASSTLSQTPGSVQRASNLLLTQRGALVTCDGSFVVGTLNQGFPLVLVIGVFNDLAAGVYPFYPVLSSQGGSSLPNLQLFIGYPGVPASVVNFFLAAAVNFPTVPLAPALLAPGDPQFIDATSTITNYNPSSTTGTATANAPPNPSTQSFLFSGWPSIAIPGGSSAIVDITFNATNQGTGIGAGQVSFDYSIDGGVTFTNNAYNSGNFPTSLALEIQITLMGITNLNLLVVRANITARYFSSGTADTATLNVTNIFSQVTLVSTLSPYGGITGKASLLPQILQFVQKTILILGNGLAPQVVDCTLLASAVPTPFSNTFTALYPNWQPAVQWLAGNQIAVIISGITYLFTAVQGGLSETPGPPPFTAALGSQVIDNQVIWRNEGAVSTSPAPRGAAHGIVYAGSLWLANTSPQTTSDQLDGPTVLKMSDANNVNSWNPLNVAFIGRDDGTQITGLATFTIAEAGIAPTGSLVVFKEVSTFQVFGVFGATDFAIDQAQTDMGCIAARTIQFLPGFGIARLAHLGFALFDGVRDKLISEEIRPYLFGGTVNQQDITGIDFSFAYFAKGIQSTTPPMYFVVAPILTNILGYGDLGYGGNPGLNYGDSTSSGAMQRIFCYDLVLKAWMIIDLPWPVSAMTQIRVGEGKPLVLAGRSTDGAILRLQSGDLNWDDQTSSSDPIDWSATLNDVFLEGSSQRMFTRCLTIRGQTLDNTLPPLISVVLTLDGITYPPIDYFLEPLPGSQNFQIDVDILQNVQIAHAQLSGQGRLVIDSIDWEATPKKGRKVVG